MTDTAEKTQDEAAAPPARPSPWAPFRHQAFAVLWVATVISNVGTWMQDVGAGWLMTELAPSPAIVSLVQAATTLPVFLFGLLAGALADVVDRRKLLLIINVIMGIGAALMAVLVASDMMTPVLLLVFTFLFGTGAAFMAPAWQAIVPGLVERKDLMAAVSLNSMGINISRAIGPALAGALIVGAGLAAPFVVNALSFIGIILALWWWRPATSPVKKSPEHVAEAIFAGVRYGLNSRPLKMTLVRAAAFFIFASAYWAMLPLIARDVLNGGASLYGILLGCIGAGAVTGAIILPRIRAAVGSNRLVAGGTLLTAAVLVAFAAVPNAFVAAIAAAAGGLAWIAVLSSLNVSAQTALPDWVRARGLSIFLTVFFGAMALGSLVWGQVAAHFGIETALLVAASGAAVMIPLTWWAKLGLGEKVDHSPAGLWPNLVAAPEGVDGHGSVRILIRYQVSAENSQAFLTAIQALGESRRRMGATGWEVRRDTEKPTAWTETWVEPSWEAHARHHDNVSQADMVLHKAVGDLTIGGAGVVTHLVRPAH